MLYLSINKSGDTLLISGSIEDITSKNRRKIAFTRQLHASISEDKISLKIDQSNRLGYLDSIADILERFNLDYKLDNSANELLESFKKEKENFKSWSIRAFNIRNLNLSDEDEIDFKKFKSSLKTLLPNRKLYEKQELSAYHMTFSQNACNFSVPGAGKTSIVYATYAYLKSLPEGDPKKVSNLMVFGPLSSFGPWENEYMEIFSSAPDSFRLSGIHSRQEKVNKLYAQNPNEIFLCSYPSLISIKNEIINFLKRYKTMVVLDEAHKIKNIEDGLIANSALDLSQHAASRIILTGTPAPNGYEDLHNLFEFIWPGKSVMEFHKNQLKSMTEHGERLESQINRLIDNISPYFIRIKKPDLGLNDPIDHEPIVLSMGPIQQKIYDYIERIVIDDFNRDTSEFSSKLQQAKLIRLMQAATNPSLLNKAIEDFFYDGPEIGTFVDDEEILELISSYRGNEIPEKFIFSLNIIKEILNRGEKVVVWFNFIENIHTFSELLSKNNIHNEKLYGDVPTGENDEDVMTREKIIRDFHKPDSKFKVLIASSASSAESISLHKVCNNAIYVERDYNAGRFAQSKDRIHRYGMDNSVYANYYFILSDCHIDHSIHQRLELKMKRMIQIMERDEIPLFDLYDSNSVSDDIKSFLENYARSN